MKSWDLDVAFKFNGENLKERTLKKLPRCSLAVLNSPMCTHALFTIKRCKRNLKGDTEIFYSICSDRKVYTNPVNH